MTQEEKQLLFKDICARLPYGVICVTTSVYYDIDDNEVGKAQGRLVSINRHGASFVDDKDDTTFGADFEDNGQIGFKPYLRPMSSMTEEEYTEYCTMRGRNCDYGEATISVSKSLYPRHLYDDGEPVKITVYYPNPVIQDWLNKKMFDYRGLIPKGLAIEAPEGMYSENC